MASAGEKIYNPVQNDWIVFRETAQDTGGELLSAELVVAPRGGNPLHVHPLQEERFKAVSGTLGVQVDDVHRSLGKGEEAVVPPGTPHRWWNEAEDEEAHVLVELRPALNSEIFFETLYGLARDSNTDDNGVPNLLQQAVTLTGVNKDEIYLASPPIPVQKVFRLATHSRGKRSRTLCSTWTPSSPYSTCGTRTPSPLTAFVLNQEPDETRRLGSAGIIVISPEACSTRRVRVPCTFGWRCWGNVRYPRLLLLLPSPGPNKGYASRGCPRRRHSGSRQDLLTGLLFGLPEDRNDPLGWRV